MSHTSVLHESLRFIQSRPAEYVLEFGGSALNGQLSSLGPWVSYDELAQMVALSFKGLGVPWPDHERLGVGCLLDLFGSIHVDHATGKPLVTWATSEACAINGDMPVMHPVIINDLYLTKDFAEKVLRLVEGDFVRVAAEQVGGRYYAFGYTASGQRHRLLPSSSA